MDPSNFNNTVSEMAATPTSNDPMKSRIPVVKRSMGIKDILVEADSINSMAGKLDCNSERRTFNNSKQQRTMKNNTSGAMIVPNV